MIVYVVNYICRVNGAQSTGFAEFKLALEFQRRVAPEQFADDIQVLCVHQEKFWSK